MQLQQLAAAFIVFKPKNNEAKYTTKWTTNGQLFIYNILKDLGIHPNK